ncbi:MAG: orotidine-5'-phosphate decarboxylase [Deltaproteobacteria bacterium]|nr:orotidine-5'-phosphate decarboxylase [Deltaproteobacteria bacterium]
MKRTEIKPRDRLIFPLDVPDSDSAIHLVERLRDQVGFFKIGLELFCREGPAIVKEVKALTSGRTGIFLDLKLHDIPNTVRGAMAAVQAMGVDLVTVHAGEGQGMLRAAKEVPGETKVLAVTVLTSLNLAGGRDLGLALEYTQPQALVLLRARHARQAGCDGVVCSGQETAAVRDAVGPEMLIVTPGIRPSWSVMEKDDQKRIVTPAQAIRDGADYLVVGRPIREASDPAKAAARVVEEIASVF